MICLQGLFQCMAFTAEGLCSQAVIRAQHWRCYLPTATAHSPALQCRVGANLTQPPAEARPTAQMGNSLQDGEFWHLFVMTGGNSIRYAPYKLKYDPHYHSFLILKTCRFCIELLHRICTCRYLQSSEEKKL